MKVPSKVKVGGYTYKIKFVKGIKKILDKEDKSNTNDAWGLCVWDQLTIYLSEDLKQRPDLLIETFIHECLHAIEESWNIPLGEKKVHTLGLALHQLIVDNNLEFKK